MLSGYSSRTGVPLVVERVEHPWTLVIESVESEMRYLKSRVSDHDTGTKGFSAVALPIFSSPGSSIGSLYMLMPRLDKPRLKVEVRILTVFSRIVGEIIERQRAAVHSANVSANIATLTILEQKPFKAALLDLLSRKVGEIHASEHLQRDMRLPFLLLSAHRPDPDEFDPAISDRLKNWLVETLQHLEWRSFLRSHWPGAPEDFGEESLIGQLPGVGMMIAMGMRVSKDELDQMPSTITLFSGTASSF